MSIFAFICPYQLLTLKKSDIWSTFFPSWSLWPIFLFHYYIGTFWYLVSKNFHFHPVIIHLERLLRCETVKICKIHRKLKYSESQDCFGNISPTKAQIFMKFYMVVNYYLVSLSLKFYIIKHSCTNAHKQVVHARTRDKT